MKLAFPCQTMGPVGVAEADEEDVFVAELVLGLDVEEDVDTAELDDELLDVAGLLELELAADVEEEVGAAELEEDETLDVVGLELELAADVEAEVGTAELAEDELLDVCDEDT